MTIQEQLEAAAVGSVALRYCEINGWSAARKEHDGHNCWQARDFSYSSSDVAYTCTHIIPAARLAEFEVKR